MKNKLSTQKSMMFIIISILFILMIMNSFGCRLYQLEKKLPPDHKEFLSKVRYIITKKEIKIFLELPDPKKEEFIEQFWRRKDPNKETDMNEFYE